MAAVPDPANEDLAARFSDVTAVTPAGATESGAQRFDAAVHPAWTIGGKPNGGYLLAMLGRAVAAVSAHPHAIAASAYYLKAPQPGPVSIDARILRSGRSTSQVRTAISQTDELCVEALFITSELNPTAPPFWTRGLPEAGATPYERCERLIPQLPNGGRVEIMEQIDLRLEPRSSGFTRGVPSGRGELRGWLALPGGDSFDPNSLLFAVDAFPPATFDIEFAGWVPTLELTVYVRALPAAGPVQVLQRAELIDGRRVDESCYVWDSGGRLVAQARQLAGLRLG